MTLGQRVVFAFFVTFLLVGISYSGVVRAQDDDSAALAAENRKLANALAETTEKLFKMKDGGGPCLGAEALQEQNESLRETIKAQNQVMAVGTGGGECQKLKEENAQLQGLKETVKELQAQNSHLSAAGNMGQTVTNQILASQDKIDELKGDVEREKQNTAAFKDKIKDYEMQLAALKKEKTCVAPAAVKSVADDFDAERLALDKQITALKLENQELTARIELLQQKNGQQKSGN